MRVFQTCSCRYVIWAFVLVLMTVPELSVSASREKLIPFAQKSTSFKVILERVYLDGEVSEEEITETIYSSEEFWNKYDQWQLMEIRDSIVVLRRQMDDISPLLKANGYFGVTDNGTLSIFNGKPNKENIIHSFFQIDVGKLESRLQLRILEGIPIKTKDQYKEVLNTFKNFTEKK